MNEFTPDETEVRTYYRLAYEGKAGGELAGPAFDRFIAKIKADAWDEGFSKGWDRGHYESGDETNPYR